MSGSALAPWTIARDTDSFTKFLAKSVNCPDSGSSSSSFHSSQTTGHSSEHLHSSSPSGSSGSGLIECLRTKSVEELLKVNFDHHDESFKTSFGPIIDGLLIPADPLMLMESENDSTHHLSYLHPMGRQLSSSASSKPVHSLMFGVTRTEAPFIFTQDEETYGIENLRRDQILYSLIKNIIEYYQEVSWPFSLYLFSPASH